MKTPHSLGLALLLVLALTACSSGDNATVAPTTGATSASPTSTTTSATTTPTTAARSTAQCSSPERSYPAPHRNMLPRFR